MILELSCVAGAVTILTIRELNAKYFNYKRDWNNLVSENKLEQYKVISREGKEWGYRYLINIKGLSYSKLEGLKEVIESYYGCDVQISQSENKSVALVDLIKNKVNYYYDWNRLMKENKLEDYKLIDVKEKEYGFSYVVNIKGLDYKKLEGIKDIIESFYNCKVEIEQSDRNKGVAIVYLITNELSDDEEFKPIKLPPHKLFIGKTYSRKDLILDMSITTHMLYSGINNSGKTYCLLTALTNLINTTSRKDVEIYLSQVSVKKDLRKFKDVEQCRGYAQTLQEAYQMFKYIYHTMEKRIGIFNSIKDKFVDDIYTWNKLYPNRKMRIAYLAMDEFSAYMPDSLDSKEEGELKAKCLDLLIKIIQQSRATGIYLLTSLQRPDKESLPPRLKAQFGNKVNFKQPNIASSLVVCDSDKAYHLKSQREFLLLADDEYIGKTLKLTNPMIDNFIKDKLDTTNSNYYNYKSNITNIEDVKKKKSKKKEESLFNIEEIQ